MSNPRRSALTSSLCCALAALAAAPASPQPLGPEFRVNTWTTDLQRGADVAALPEGGFVVVWESDDQDGHSWGVFGRRFDAEGDPLSGEFQVNQYTQGHQFLADVSADANGEFVVAWESIQEGNSTGIYARLFEVDTAPRGDEFQVNVYTPQTQGWPLVSRNPAGDFVVAWSEQNFGQPEVLGVFARRFDASGTPTTGDLTIVPRNFDPNPFARGLLLRSDGDFVVGWKSCAYIDPWERDCDVLVRGFGIPGPLTSPIRVNTYTTGDQSGGLVAARGDGEFLVTWWSNLQDGSGTGVYGRRFDAEGAPLGDEFRINSYTPGSQFQQAVAVDERGNVLVAWTSEDQDGSGEGIFAQHYGASGAPIGPEFQVNSWTTDDQRYPAVAALGPGDFVVAWDSNGQDGSLKGIYARLVTTGLLVDGFESGDTSGWSVTVGG